MSSAHGDTTSCVPIHARECLLLGRPGLCEAQPQDSFAIITSSVATPVRGAPPHRERDAREGLAVCNA